MATSDTDQKLLSQSKELLAKAGARHSPDQDKQTSKHSTNNRSSKHARMCESLRKELLDDDPTGSAYPEQDCPCCSGRERFCRLVPHRASKRFRRRRSGSVSIMLVHGCSCLTPGQRQCCCHQQPISLCWEVHRLAILSIPVNSVGKQTLQRCGMTIFDPCSTFQHRG